MINRALIQKEDDSTYTTQVTDKALKYHLQEAQKSAFEEEY